MKKILSALILTSIVASGAMSTPVLAFTIQKDGDEYNFAKNIPTPTFNILYEKVGISKPDAVFTKSDGSLFEARMAVEAEGNQIFGVQMPYAALPNHTNMLYKLNAGDNRITGSYSFLFPDSVRDNRGDYYDLRISENNIKIGSREERNVRSNDHVTLFSIDRALVSRSTGGTSINRTGLGHQGDFTISVEKNGIPVEGSFIFSARDLDIPDHVTESVTYPNYSGPYSESLQDVTGTISNMYLTDNTTLRVVGGNRVVGSVSNNDLTYKSGFAFLANATQVVHLGISGAATGVPILLERSFSSFEQSSGEGGAISAKARGEDYDSVSGRLITIPSAADGSNAVVYTMTPDSCHKAKSITLSVHGTGGVISESQIEVANLAEHPVEGLSLDDETGVLTYTYPNTDDYYRRYSIHVEWEEEDNCPVDPMEETTDPTTPDAHTTLEDNPSTETDNSAKNESSTNSEAESISEKAPNSGIASNAKDGSGARFEFIGLGIVIGTLVYAITMLKRKLA